MANEMVVQRATLKVPGRIALEILNAVPEVQPFVVVEPDKVAIRAILDQCGEVPGATLTTGEETLSWQ